MVIPSNKKLSEQSRLLNGNDYINDIKNGKFFFGGGSAWVLIYIFMHGMHTLYN